MGLFDFFKKKKSEDVADTIESSSKYEVLKLDEQPKDEAVKRFNFMAKGTFTEDHQNEIKKLISELEKAEYFFLEPYEGLTNKEIIECCGDKIYEYGGYSLPKGYLENDDHNEFDENAIKVFITNLNGDKIHMGYVSKELCLEIRELNEKYEMYVSPSIEKGKYKIANYNDKIKTEFEDYEIGLSVSFWEVLPESLRKK